MTAPDLSGGPGAIRAALASAPHHRAGRSALIRTSGSGAGNRAMLAMLAAGWRGGAARVPRLARSPSAEADAALRAWAEELRVVIAADDTLASGLRLLLGLEEPALLEPSEEQLAAAGDIMQRLGFAVGRAP